MTAAAFPDVPADERNAWIPEFLATYERELGRHGDVFDGIEAMLRALEDAGAAWGIVTNKPEYLARELLPMLGWDTRCAVLIGGDTLPERKPHPLPLLHAAKLMGVAAADCVYVGDDERDIVAARARRHALGRRVVGLSPGRRRSDGVAGRRVGRTAACTVRTRSAGRVIESCATPPSTARSTSGARDGPDGRSPNPSCRRCIANARSRGSRCATN